MSCDDDDYGWDEEPEPIIEVVQLNLTVDTVSREKLDSIVKGLSLCLDRKLDKLNLMLKNLDVWVYQGNLLVNDRYNICPNFKDIAESFGMDCLPININGIKGKTYILNDKVAELIKILDTNYQWMNVVPNAMLFSGEIQIPSLFMYHDLHSVYDKELENYLLEIKRNGMIYRTGTETFIDGVSQGKTVDVSSIKERLEQFSKDVSCQAKSNNRQLQNGKAEILYTRARQMGYAVEKKTDGKTVQLIMVRLET